MAWSPHRHRSLREREGTAMSLRLIQQGLMGLRYDVGPADDKWGPRTERAMQDCVAGRGQPFRPQQPVASAAPGSPRIFQGSARYLVDEIVVHCSATLPAWMAGQLLAAKVAEIRRWHVEDRGWRDVGYHYIIDRDGARATGRAETVIGAGVEGHNRGVLHVCLIGGHGSSSTDPFLRNFTAAQDADLRSLIADIRRRTTIARVSGHNEHAAKACPGFNVPAWLNAA
jgi:hypothetical protein